VTAKEIKFPFYAKATFLIIGLVAFAAILYIAQDIIVPLIFAILIAILLHPVVNFLIRWKINRFVAISIALLLTFLVVAAFAGLLFSQASRFSESWPLLVDKFTGLLNQITSWISGYFDINPHKIDTWIAKTKSELINTSGIAIGQTLLNVGSVIMVLLLVPLYVFLLLFYHPLLIDFIRKVFAGSNPAQVSEIITQTKTVIQRYLMGLVIEAVLVAGMDISALLLLGIDYAILLGILGALLNVIPYIGGIVAVALPMMIALVTKSSVWYALYVLAAYYGIQLIDNNFIVIKIVASKVKINALFSIIVVLVGNALWGIPGMFLSLPLLAIVKVVFDHIDPLKPWGLLLGDTMPSILKVKLNFKKLKQAAV